MRKVDILNNMAVFKNKGLYYDCPVEYRRDFDFIVEVIKIFKDDFDFIDEVAESYCKYIPSEGFEEDRRFIELCLLLGDFIPDSHPDYEFYTSRSDGIYSMFLLDVMMVKDELPGMSDLGFSILLEDYGDRKNILDYFAKRMTRELYYCSCAGTFEDLMHKNFEDFEVIKREGFEDFLIRSLTNVDFYLGEYVFNNRHLLDEFVNELNEIGVNWENYNNVLLEKSVHIVREWLSRKMEDNTYGNDFDYQYVFDSVVVSMGFGKLFGINGVDSYVGDGTVVAFSSFSFRNDLRKVIEKVFMEKATLTELDSLELDEEKVPKKGEYV